MQGGIQILHKLRQKRLYNEVIHMLKRLKQLTYYEQQCQAAMTDSDFPTVVRAARS